MNKSNFSREVFLLKKKKEALTKVHSFRENFKKRELEMKADLEKAGEIWKKVGEKFKWWESLP